MPNFIGHPLLAGVWLPVAIVAIRWLVAFGLRGETTSLSRQPPAVDAPLSLPSKREPQSRGIRQLGYCFCGAGRPPPFTVCGR